MARAVFGLSAEDVERLQQAIMSYGDGAEKVINNYLKNEASNIFTQAIINYIPISNRDKQHAKDSSPLKAEQKENLSLYIHTKTQYNYLYFPQEAEGVHFQGKVPNDFMQHGVDAQYDNVVNNLLEKLQNNFK
mgnify:FL=1